MKARIYYKIGYYEDSIVITGDSIEELREKMKGELTRRGAQYCGSEILDEESNL